MLSKKLGITLTIISLLPLGITAQAIFFSGTELREFPFQGREGATRAVTLDPTMNPLRLLIHMDYGGKAHSTVQRHIRYEVGAHEPGGGLLWSESGRASVNSDKKLISQRTHHSSLQTFDVQQVQDVEFRYRIEEANLRYKGGRLTLKRNVTRHRWAFTIVGLAMLVSGVLIFSGNQKRSG